MILCLLTGFPAKAQVWKSNAFPTIIQLFPPLDGDLKVNGTFAEPRLNHFHAGLDLKTDERIGLPVRAAEDGYISRIKIASNGYGNALYVTHPALGITTVYAHLDAFDTIYQQWTIAQQYQKERFEIDTLLSPTLFKVSKGQKIAFSGNTGSSGGPHLHFEVRNTQTELALNPMRFGLKITDTKAPEIKSLKVYQVDNGFYSYKGKNYPVKKLNNDYQTDRIIVSPGKIALSIQAFDQQDLTPLNKNGVRSIKILKEGSLIYHWQVDTIDFGKSKYVHAMLDYSEKVTLGKDYYLACKLPNNLYPFAYPKLFNEGIISLNLGDSAIITCLLEDFAGNISKLTSILSATAPSLAIKSYTSNFLWAVQGFQVKASASTFYDKVFLNLKVDSSKKTSWVGSRYYFSTPIWIPIHESFVIQLDGSKISPDKKEKAVIVQETPDGKRKALKSSWQGNNLTANALEVCTYGIQLDSKKPRIKLLNFHSKHHVFEGKSIEIEIEDNLSGIAKYKGTIDGNWVLFSFDAKNKRLSYQFDEKCPSGEHQLSLIVTDNCNNIQQLSILFKN